MYWKITELKDDVDYSKDDLNISPIDSLKRMFILITYVFRCNGHVPATDSHRRVGAAQTSAKRS